MKLGLRWYDSIFIVLFIYLFVLQIQAIWPFTIDDMYISLRYAKNWASSSGLLWNIHEPAVEGYSNFSFVALAALTLLLKGNPVLILKIAGLIGLFFTCFFLYLITRFWFGKRESLLPALCLLFYKGQIIWATSGLETAVYESLICGVVYFCWCGMGYQSHPQLRRTAQKGAFILAGLLLALAGMTRPEAPALMILFFILICWDGPYIFSVKVKNNTLSTSRGLSSGSRNLSPSLDSADKPQDVDIGGGTLNLRAVRPQTELANYWHGVFYFSATLVLIYGPYYLWRISYFGYLFPNSVYCKGLSNVFTLSLDINYLKLIWPLILFSLPACIKTHDKRHYFLWLPSLVYLLILADADPIVSFENRLFLPAFALLLPLTIQGISIIVFRYLHHSTIFGLCFYVAVFWMAFFFIPGMTLADYRYFSKNPLQGELLRGRVVTWLNNHMASGTSVVLADSGMIPYQSDLNFIDSYCLNNKVMAHYPVQQRYEKFCNEILFEKPEVVILTSLLEHGQVHYTPSDVCLRSVLEKQNDYKFIQSFRSNTPNSIYRYELFIHSPRRR